MSDSRTLEGRYEAHEIFESITVAFLRDAGRGHLVR